MSAEAVQKPVFFSIRKNVSYFMWRPYENFFDFKAVCIEALGEDGFVLCKGDCLKVQQLGRKYLASATRFKKLKNGIYLLVKEESGKYVFKLIRPLRRKA